MQYRRIFLFVGALGISLYFTVRFVLALLNYLPLQETIEAKVTRWEIEETDQNYALKANYSFEIQENIWEKSHRFGDVYVSQAAALADLKAMAKGPWKAWFNPSNPSQASLERVFPTNLLIRMLICYGISIYFFLLSRKLIY